MIMSNKTSHFCEASLLEFYKEHTKSTNKPMLVLCRSNDQAERVEYTLQKLSDANTIVIPDNETLPYDEEFPQDQIISQRFKGIAKLKSSKNKKDVFIITIRSAMEKIVDGDFYDPIFDIKNNDLIELPDAIARLESAGYVKCQSVNKFGEFSINPNTFDIFPYGSDVPVRIYLNNSVDDENNTFFFDPDKKTNISVCKNVSVYKTMELPFTERSRQKFSFKYRQHFSDFKNSFFNSVKEGIAPRGIDYFKPLFTDAMTSLLHLLPETTRIVSLVDLNKEAEALTASFESRFKEVQGHRNVLSPQDILLTIDEIEERVSFLEHVEVNSKSKSARKIYSNNVKKQEKIHQTFKLIEAAHEKTKRTLITINSETRLRQLEMMFKMKGKAFDEVDSWNDFLSKGQGFYVLKENLDFGYINRKEKFTLITEFEIFDSKTTEEHYDIEGDHKSLAVEFKMDEPVVHAKYGIGRFKGFKTFNDSNSEKEYAVIEYAEGANIWVALNEMNLVSEYKGMDPETIPLDSASSKDWNKHLLSAVSDVKKMAHKLLEIKAKRQAIKRTPYEVPAFEYRKFANEFPYMITDDQGKAIKNILDDMKGDIAMDRLVVGDVGYGKTEVAMRAAMIAAFNKRQCCILAPTTLLAEQHFESFVDRFDGMNLNIKLLTRENKSEAKKILQGMKSGEVDIVIGTHRLIQKDITFANLGLMVVDEEHRFGVKQKEDINKQRGVVDILSLSATPIPRTLSLTMHGIRDISTIRTAPQKRLAVRTQVTEYNDADVVDAIRREIGRGGQVFYVFNDTQAIEAKSNIIKKLVPEAEVDYAHGKMQEREMHDVMQRFRANEFNVLVATTIIETGIDVPNANTIIIDEAENLGLAQMHQLRGRVGRSSKQAYAYLMCSEGAKLTEKAEMRLKAMSENNNLGGGFKISNADLEIRGAGEVLGESQSGHIQEIGYQMYFSLLDRAMHMLDRGESLDELSGDDDKLVFHIPSSLSIPSTYIENKGIRASYYKAIFEAKDEASKRALTVEMEHRFGTMPDSVNRLIDLAFAKVQCENEGVKKVKINKNTVVITLKSSNVKERLVKQAEKIGLPVIEADSSDDCEVSVPLRHIDMSGVIDYVKVKELIVQ